MASLYGHAPMIDLLLKGGGDPKRRGRNGETLVMLAARNGNPDAIKRLVAAGADVNARETAAEHDGIDVGGGTAASGRGQDAARSRRRPRGANRARPACPATTWRRASIPPPLRRPRAGTPRPLPRDGPTNNNSSTTPRRG